MLILLRHGESAANAAGLLAGRQDVELTERGKQQAMAAAGRLRPAVTVRSSPLVRARETAAAVAGTRSVVVDERWVEVDYGIYDGLPLAEVPADVWQLWRSDPEYRPPGGEALANVRRRVGDACRELFAVAGAGARDPAGDVVVVSHVSPIKAAVGWALGVDVPLDTRLHLGTGSVTAISCGPDGPVLETFNQQP